MKENFKLTSNGFTGVDFLIGILIAALIILFVAIPIIYWCVYRARMTEQTVNLTHIEELGYKLRVKYAAYMVANGGEEPDSSYWSSFMDEAVAEFVNDEIVGCVITEFDNGNVVFENCQINEFIYKYHYSEGPVRVK